MSNTSGKGTYEQGREDQFRDMMKAVEALEAKYSGVRGELLAKVRAELATLKPAARGLSLVASQKHVNTSAFLPSCRACGRQMKRTGTNSTLVCQNGHTRVL